MRTVVDWLPKNHEALHGKGAYKGQKTATFNIAR
jgi:hypothetical protein